MDEELDISILRAITQHQKLALDFSARYSEVFFTTEYSKIAQSLLSYIRHYKSLPTLKSIKEKNIIDDELCSQFDELYSLEPYDPNDYNFDIEKLKNRFSQIKFDSLKDQINESYEINDKLLNNIKKQLNDIKSIDQEKSYKRISLKEYLPDFIESYKTKKENPEMGKGIMSKYSYVDYITNGFKPNDLVLICAETGAGKSLFLNNMAINIWKQNNKIDTSPEEYTKGYNVVYFSLEMSHEDCHQRTIAALADVPSYGLRDANLSAAETAAVKQACKFQKNFPYTFDIIDVPRGFTVDQLEMCLEDIRADYNPDVILIDYMQLMDISFGGDDSDWLKLGDLAGKLHEFTRQYNIPIITAAQLNRMEPNSKSKNPIGLHRIGRSSMIAHHCTLIVQIESRENEDTLDDFVYHIIKNRHGEKGKHTIYKNFAHCSIKDRPYEYGNSREWLETSDISNDIAELIDI